MSTPLYLRYLLGLAVSCEAGRTMMCAMGRPMPTLVMHFTHVDNLADVISNGLSADSIVRATGAVVHEVGDASIKERRRGLPVTCGPGGFVGDYVPFYFAPRSPMMYVLKTRGVPILELVYLVTTLEALLQAGSDLVYTDRNAAVGVAQFTTDLDGTDDLVDWPLMKQKMWSNTDTYPDRMECRMAETLAHDHVDWASVSALVVSSSVLKTQVEGLLASVEHQPEIFVRPGWYY